MQFVRHWRAARVVINVYCGIKVCNNPDNNGDYRRRTYCRRCGSWFPQKEANLAHATKKKADKILCPVTPISSQSCNYPVKNVRINAYLSKGCLGIEGNKVVASRDICGSPNDILYTVTIDKHYILLYHVKTAKFICWNKSFTKLVARRNPNNLTYCKFEDKPSKIQDKSMVRYVTTHNDREIEIRFNRNGVFASRKTIRRCLRRQGLIHIHPFSYYMELNPKTIEKTSKEEYEAYVTMSSKCASPDFFPVYNTKPNSCVSRLPEFCTEMKIRKNNGHNITSELSDLCKHEWNKRN